MNFKESRPIYLQIADRIMDEIMQHAYSEGGRIPSVREYAATVEVTPTPWCALSTGCSSKR